MLQFCQWGLHIQECSRRARVGFGRARVGFERAMVGTGGQKKFLNIFLFFL